MEREYREIDTSTSEMTFIAQSNTELQQLHRTLMCPETHELRVVNDGMKFTVRPVLKSKFQPETSPADGSGGDGDDDGADQVTAHMLEKLTKEQLLTKAAELEVEGVSDKNTKAEIAASILKKIEA